MSVVTESAACQCQSPGTGWLGALLPVWRCAAPVPLAGFAGALIDQWHHAGFVIWLNFCQTAAPDPLAALGLQAQLMPAMLAAMAGAMAWQWVRRPAGHGALVLALCQAGCLGGMLLAAGLCAALAGLPGGDGIRLLAMGVVDLAMSLAGATVLVAPIMLAGRWPTRAFS